MGKRSNVRLQWRGTSESEERFRIGLGEGYFRIGGDFSRLGATKRDTSEGVLQKGYFRRGTSERYIKKLLKAQGYFKIPRGIGGKLPSKRGTS